MNCTSKMNKIIHTVTTTIALLFLGLFSFYKLQYDKLKLEIAENQTKHEQQMRAVEQSQYKEVINAINEANAQRIKVEIDSSDAESANKRLRQTIDRLNVQVSQLSASARIEYSNSLGELLKECTAAYRTVARKADGHAADAKLMQNILKSVPSAK